MLLIVLSSGLEIVPGSQLQEFTSNSILLVDLLMSMFYKAYIK